MYDSNAASHPPRRLNTDGIPWIFWGTLLFVFLDFRLQGFDIFPDFVGYILIASGLWRMRESSPLLRRASYFAIVCIPLSLGSFYEPPQDPMFAFSGFYQAPEPLFGLPFTLVLVLLNFVFGLLLSYHIIFGIGHLAQQMNRPAIESWCKPLFIARLATMTLVAALFVVPLLIIPAIAIGLTVEVIYMVFLRKAHKALL